MNMLRKATGHLAGRLRRGAVVIFMVAGAATLASCAAPAPSDSQAADEPPQDLVFPPPPETPRFFFERTILGSYLGSRKEFTDVMHLLGSKSLKPVVDATFPLERTAEAHEYLEGRHAFGKVVVKIA